MRADEFADAGPAAVSDLAPAVFVAAPSVVTGSRLFLGCDENCERRPALF